jgi:hypothetical protein
MDFDTRQYASAASHRRPSLDDYDREVDAHDGFWSPRRLGDYRDFGGEE